MKRYALAAGVVGLFVLLVACGSSAQPAAPTSGGIVITGFAYTGTLTVKPGQTVTVTNDDPTEHTLTDVTTLGRQTPTGQTPTGQKTGMFSTGTIPPSGGTATLTAPAEPGSYPFGCRLHPTMKGTLTVQGGT